jgi:hypothetical protein
MNETAETWNDADVVGYTPTITSGISFEGIHFDQLFAYGCGGSCDVKSFLQMFYRVRNLNDGSMYVYIDPTTYKDKPTDPVDILSYVQSHWTTIRKTNELISMRLKTSTENNTEWYCPIEDELFRLYLDNLEEEFKSRNNFKQEFMELIDQKQIPSQGVPPTYNPPDVEVVETVQPTLTEQQVLDIKDIEEGQLEVLETKQREGNLSYDEKMSILKFKCCQIYQMSASQLSKVPHYCSWDYLKRYKARSQLVNTKHLQSQMEEFVGKNIYNRKFLDCHNIQYDFYIYQMLFMDILKLPDMTQKSFNAFHITGGQLLALFKGQQQLIAEHTEAISMQMRHKTNKMVTKQKCLEWNKSSQFVKFFNSFIEPILGLKICVKTNKSNIKNSIWEIKDTFNPEEIQIKSVKGGLDKNYLADD